MTKTVEIDYIFKRKDADSGDKGMDLSGFW